MFTASWLRKTFCVREKMTSKKRHKDVKMVTRNNFIDNVKPFDNVPRRRDLVNSTESLSMFLIVTTEEIKFLSLTDTQPKYVHKHFN